jgi:hypothetical protein
MLKCEMRFQICFFLANFESQDGHLKTILMVIVCVCVDELMLYLYPSFPLAFMHVCSQWHAREILGCDEIFGGCVFKFYSEGVYLNLMGQPNIKNVLEFCGPA